MVRAAADPRRSAQQDGGQPVGALCPISGSCPLPYALPTTATARNRAMMIATSSAGLRFHAIARVMTGTSCSGIWVARVNQGPFLLSMVSEGSVRVLYSCSTDNRALVRLLRQALMVCLRAEHAAAPR